MPATEIVLTTDLLPEATLPQLLITLLMVGALVLMIATPGLLRQRRVQQFQKRVQERDQNSITPAQHGGGGQAAQSNAPTPRDGEAIEEKADTPD